MLIDDLYKQKRELEMRIQFGNFHVKESVKERIHFVRQCPANGCRGFLSTQWKCGICDQWTCPDCHELKGPNRDCDHTCDPNNVETAKLLAKDSKPCPKCQSLIYKINGCSQMWCTQCHTAFNWNTGKLENNIHNPHFYEWQRKNGGANRNIGDIECGRDLTHNTCNRIHTLIQRHSDLYKIEIKNNYQGYRHDISYSESITNLVSIVRNIIHNNHVELPQFHTDYVLKNQDLRIRYLENDMSENEFKMCIQRNDKKSKKNIEISQVLQLANTTVTDIVYRVMDNLEKSDNGKHNVLSYLNEIEEIRNYCNNILKDIAFTYNTVQYGFNIIFQFGRITKVKKVGKKNDSNMSLTAAAKANDTDDDDNI